jgi:hypothetical protein
MHTRKGDLWRVISAGLWAGIGTASNALQGCSNNSPEIGRFGRSRTRRLWTSRLDGNSNHVDESGWVSNALSNAQLYFRE